MKRFNSRNSKLDYVLYLMATTILGTPILCGVMELLKNFLNWIM